MSRFARRRDLAEPAIVRALLAVGASVQRLDATGAPDLLVGFRNETYLLEVKDQHGKAERHGKRTESGLRETQEAWWSTWKGKPPAIVTTAREALCVLGVASSIPDVQSGSDCAPPGKGA
jgi:hypothetical protein